MGHGHDDRSFTSYLRLQIEEQSLHLFCTLVCGNMSVLVLSQLACISR